MQVRVCLKERERKCVFAMAIVLLSISSTFYERLFCTKVFSAAFFYLHVSRKKLRKALLYEKCIPKMLMKLRAGVNFIKVLLAALALAVP